MGGISIWQLLIVLLIIVLLFGSKKLRGLGGDLGSAMRGFKKEMSNDDDVQNSKQDAVAHRDDADFEKRGADSSQPQESEGTADTERERTSKTPRD